MKTALHQAYRVISQNITQNAGRDLGGVLLSVGNASSWTVCWRLGRLFILGDDLAWCGILSTLITSQNGAALILSTLIWLRPSNAASADARMTISELSRQQ